MDEEIELHPRAVDPDAAPRHGDPSLGELAQRLFDDGQTLLRQEVDLAKTELVETAGRYARASLIIGLGVLVLLIGLSVLLAFLVLALGAILGDRYWLSTLLIGLTLAIAGAFAVRGGRARLTRESVLPDQTVDSLRATAAWATEQRGRLKGGAPPRRTDDGEDSR